MLQTSRPVVTFWAVGLLAVLAGCGGPAPTTGEVEGGSAFAPGVASADPKPGSATLEDSGPPTLVDPADVDPSDYAGRWRFVMYQESNDLSGGFVTVEASDDGGLDARDFVPTEVFQGSKLEEVRVADGRLELQFRFAPPEGADADFVPPTFAFSGLPADDGVVYGLMLFPGYNAEPVRLKRVPAGAVLNEAELAKIPLGPTEGRLAVQAALSAGDPFTEFRRLTETMPDSPAVFDGLSRFLRGTELLADVSEDQLRETTDAFIETGRFWGEPHEAFAAFMSALSLKRSGVAPALAEERAGAALAIVPEEFAAQWRASLDFAAELGRVAVARREADAAKEAAEAGETDLARSKIDALEAEFRLDPVVLYRSGEVAEIADDIDTGLTEFGKLVALPGLMPMLDRTPLRRSLNYTPPRGRLTELWLEKNGTLEGFEAFLDEVYEEHLFDRVALDSDRPVEGRPDLTAGPTAHLVELFTGQGCPPCVAADVGTEALESAPRSSADVFVLRYHLHIPAPDQLSTEPSVSRSGYYQIEGTPTAYVDGTPTRTQVPGGYGRTGVVFEGLAEEILPSEPLERTPRLDVSAGDGVVHISTRAEADGLPETVRLRVVLAEREIDMPAMNGIRVHHAVVRAMPGGSDGLPADEGKWQFEESVAVADVRAEIDKHLDEFEELASNDEFAFEFRTRPRDLDDLVVVAFLQDDATRRILGAAVAPVDVPTSEAAASGES